MPTFAAAAMPRVIHYGLIYDVEYKGATWQFDKHWYFKFDAHACPPWNLKSQKPQAGIFPPPPHPSKLHHKVSSGRTRLCQVTDGDSTTPSTSPCQVVSNQG